VSLTFIGGGGGLVLGFFATFGQIALKEHPKQKNRKEERKPHFTGSHPEEAPAHLGSGNHFSVCPLKLQL